MVNPWIIYVEVDNLWIITGHHDCWGVWWNGCWRSLICDEVEWHPSQITMSVGVCVGADWCYKMILADTKWFVMELTQLHHKTLLCLWGRVGWFVMELSQVYHKMILANTTGFVMELSQLHHKTSLHLGIHLKHSATVWQTPKGRPVLWWSWLNSITNPVVLASIILW